MLISTTCGVEAATDRREERRQTDTCDHPALMSRGSPERGDSRSLHMDWDSETPVTPCAGENSGRVQVLAGDRGALPMAIKAVELFWDGPTIHCTFRVPGGGTNCGI